MPHFGIQIGASGPLLDAFIGISKARQDALKAANQPIPPMQQIRALLDTGASCTCCDPDIISKLGIPPTGTAQIKTPSTGATPHVANVYDVSITIPGATPPVFSLDNIAVVETSLFASQGFHALIGRDILEKCVIHYNGVLKMVIVSY